MKTQRKEKWISRQGEETEKLRKKEKRNMLMVPYIPDLVSQIRNNPPSIAKERLGKRLVRTDQDNKEIEKE